MLIVMSTWTVLKKWRYWKNNEKILPDKTCFYRSGKDGTTGDNGEILDGHISDEDYLTYKKIWNEFNMRNMGDYRDHYSKEMVYY